MSYPGISGKEHGEMFCYENAVDTVINEQDSYEFIQGILSDNGLHGFTFDAGSTGSITAWADASGDVTATSAGHTLAVGDQVNIAGTTNYNGTYLVKAINVNDFDITHSWDGDDAEGVFTQPDCLIVLIAGDYYFNFSCSLRSDGNGKTYKFELVNNTIHKDDSATERKIGTGSDIGSMGSGGVMTIAVGDRIALQVTSPDATVSNITLVHCNVSLIRV